MVHMKNLPLLWLFYFLKVTAVRLKDCAADRAEIDLEESTAGSTPIVCDQVQSENLVIWGVYLQPTANVLEYGICHPTTNCSDSSINIMARTPLNAPNSTITLTKLSRDNGGNWDIQCQGKTTANPPTVTGTARCHLNIMYAARKGDTSCSITASFSHVTVSCRIPKVFSSTGSYFCEFIRESTLGMNKTRSSYNPQMSGSPQYGSGTCQYSAPLPSTTGTYNYTVVVYPGALAITISGSVVIAEPDASPTIGCNDTNGYVPEYSALVCSCTARNFGSPIGYLQVQRVGNVLVTNGTEGRNLTFTIQTVTRAQDGEVYTCVLYWVQNRQSTYTLNFTYGPDTVNLSGPDQFDFNPTNPRQLTLNCTASGYKPSVRYTWSGACVNSTSSTCTFAPTPSNNGDVINCTAINTITKQQRTSSHTLKIRYPPLTPPLITGYSGQAVNENQTVTMNCTVNGGNPPVTSVTFVCGNTIQTSAGTSAVISITADSSRHGQTCVCSANWNNTFPPLYTQTANITIAVNYGPNNVTLNDPGEFYLHPTNHNQLTLTCEASGYSPNVTYRWSGVCASTTIKTCTVNPKESNNGDVVSCTAINIVTNVQRTSNSRTLIIRYPPNLPPVITGYTSGQVLYAGQSVTINCTVNGGNPSVTSVTLRCGNLTQTSAGTSAVISKTADSSRNGQTCVCSANWNNTSPPWYTLNENVSLVVYYAPTAPIINTTGLYPFLEGESPTLVCSFPPGADRGNPSSSLTWQGGQGISDRNESRLTLTRIKGPEDHNRTVVCEASNDFTVYNRLSITTVFRVLVYYISQVVLFSGNTSDCIPTTSPDPYCVVDEGQRVVVQCTAEGNPAIASVTWLTAVPPNAVLNFTASRNTSVVHVCKVSTGTVNSDIRLPLNKSRSLHVYTRFSPQIRQFQINDQSNNVTVNETERVTVTCTAEGRPTPALSLVKDGTALVQRPQGLVDSTDVTVTVEHPVDRATCSDAATYKCGFDSDVNYLTLRVNCYPRNLALNLKSDEAVNFEGVALTLPLDFVAYPKPHSYSFTFLGPFSNLTVPIFQDVMSLHCWDTQFPYSFTCNISVDNINETLAGNYSLTLSNDFGYASVSYVVSFNETTSTTKEWTSTTPDPAVIGGAVGAAIVAAVLVIVIVAFIVYRRKKVGSPRHDRKPCLSEPLKTSDDVLIDNSLYETTPTIKDKNVHEPEAPKRYEYEIVDTGFLQRQQQYKPSKSTDITKSSSSINPQTGAAVTEEDSTVDTRKKNVKPQPVFASLFDGKNNTGNKDKGGKAGKRKKNKDKGKQKTNAKPRNIINSPLSMEAIDPSVYENYAFQTDDSVYANDTGDKTSKKTPEAQTPQESQSRNADGLVYADLVFGQEQQIRAMKLPPAKEPTVYADIVFKD